MVLDKTVNATYIGSNNLFHLEQNHSYKIIIEQNKRGTYDVSVTYDNTTDEEVDLYCPYASENSVRKYWNLEDCK